MSIAVDGTISVADPEPVRLIAPDGSPLPDERYQPELTAAELIGMYELMALTRELDTEFVNLQRQGQLALFPSCRGQEAAQVGCAAAVRANDWLFPRYRELRDLIESPELALLR